jgi:D-alanyl-D-alanine carboxypeptidase/D-alanyl-D-alanine-endopeptidase (penicillin-binding protein 4)
LLSRWTVLVVALVVASIASTAVAIQAEREPASAAASTSASAAAVTPVLSARRVPALIAAPVADRRLAAHLTDLASSSPGTSCLTVAVDGRMVFSSNATTPLIPASVEKLQTAEAALTKLGPTTVFTTSVKSTSQPGDGVVDGNLWLVGGGDPLLMTDAYAAHFRNQPVTRTSLEQLADQIVAAGVHEVHGSVVGDDSRYDRARGVPQWAGQDISADDIGPLGALMVNDGLTQFPPTFNAHVPPNVAAADPAQDAANQLTLLLQARGVEVAGPAQSGTAPQNNVELTKIDSKPVDQLVGEMLRESDNETAELLTKELGLHDNGGGTTANGTAVIHQTLQDKGLPMDGTTEVDGSGLSRSNQTTCGFIQALLDSEGPGSTLANDLAVAGQTGTLALRFLGTPLVGQLRAKTGTLNQVTALAGYVQTAKGSHVSFAYVINLPPPQRVTNDDVALGDALGSILFQYPETPDLSVLGPKSG